MRQTGWSAIAFAIVLAGCGSSKSAVGPGAGGADADADADTGDCVDLDGDGYGVGSECAGNDCNDLAAGVHTEGDCAEYCSDAGGVAPGCPCAGDEEPADCYLGPFGTQDVGDCRGGRTTCRDSFWSACDGQVVPSTEQCNEVDDDCDGDVDEGVASTCGTCDPNCEALCAGIGCGQGFDPAEGRSVELTPEGGLTLDERVMVVNRVIWVANSGEGTVTKIDTTTRQEVGRYKTGFAGAADNPSRTTVNANGDVVVSNRGPGGEATKYLASGCRDADGDGEIETSTGRLDVYDFQEDECWAWTTPIGAGARGSAFEMRSVLDGGTEEYVWIGDYTHRDVHELDSETGTPTGRTVGGLTPYGLVLDPNGKLWTFQDSTHIISIDTTTLETEAIALPEGERWYGITSDHLGRIWIGGTVARYDPADGTWVSPAAEVTGGGIAVDALGNAWVGEQNAAYKIDVDTLEATPVPGAGGHGWAVDFDGYLWSIVLRSTTAHVVDPATLEVVDVVPPFTSAYTYSDMTGFQLLNTVDPEGVYPLLFEGCASGDTEWGDLSWEADLPPGTSIAFTARTGEDAASIAELDPVPIAAAPPDSPPVPIEPALTAAGVTLGRYLLVEATLRSDSREHAPVLQSLAVTRTCEPEIE